MYYTEKEVIEQFLSFIEPEAKKQFGLSLKLKKTKISEPKPTEVYKDYKDGQSSTEVEVHFELTGWKSYQEDGLDNFIKSILDLSDEFDHIVSMDVYSFDVKGKHTVTADMNFVYTRMNVMDTKFEANNNLSSDSDAIIKEIELRLSEIYALLKKLKK